MLHGDENIMFTARFPGTKVDLLDSSQVKRNGRVV